MLPFSVELKSGLPVAEQILFAVKKAVISGQLRAGEKFPSVRQLSQELKVNPNTAHKVVAALVQEGVLLTTPAVGSVVAPRKESGSRRERTALLAADLERLAVEGRKLGLDLADLQDALATQWHKLGPTTDQ